MSTAAITALSFAGLIAVILAVVKWYGTSQRKKGIALAIMEVQAVESEIAHEQAVRLARRSYSRDELIQHGMREARADSFREDSVPGDKPADVGGAGGDSGGEAA